MPPQSISHGSFLRIVTSLTRPVSAVQPKAPLPKGRRAAAVNFARQLSTHRYFPDPPGIGSAAKGSLAKGAACRRSQFRTAAFYASLLPRPARYRRCSQRLPACGSWHGEAVTEGFTVGDFSKAPTHVDTCQPGESPRLGVAEAPPFHKGGFGLRPKTPPSRREV